MQAEAMSQRTLCLDVGDKRVGIAVSDPFGKTALGVTTLERGAFKKDCKKILDLVQNYSCATIVIGLPLDMENQEGPQAKKVRFFAEGLEKFLNEKGRSIILKLYDESFSTKGACEVLLESNTSRQKRKKIIDQLAAQQILQDYLDASHD